MPSPLGAISRPKGGPGTFLLWRGIEVQAGVAVTSQQAALEWAERVLDDANEHVPFDTGELMDTGAAQALQPRGAGGRFASGDFEAVVSYDTPYAVHLHEHPEFDFQPPGEGKWLHNALYRSAPAAAFGIAPRYIRFFRSELP